MTGDTPQKRSLTSQMLDTAVASVAFMALTFIAGVMLSRLLGPEGRGIYGTVQFWAQLGFGLLSFSVFDAAVIRLRKSKDHPESALPSVMVLALAALAIYVLVATAAVALDLIEIGDFGGTTFIWASALLVALGLSTRAFTVVESAKLDFRRLNIERIVSPVLFVLAIGLLFLLDIADPLVMVLAFVAAAVPILVWRIIRFRGYLIGRVDRQSLRSDVRTGGKLHLATGSFSLARQFDRILLVAIWPAQLLGFYFVAFTAASASVSLVMQSLSVTLLPTLSGLDPELRKKRLEQLLRLAILSVFATAVPIILVAPYIVPLVYGEAFREAAWYLQGLAIPTALFPLQSIINIANRSVERVWPSIAMAASIIGVFAIGYAVTGYDDPKWVFVALATGNAIAVAIGIFSLRSYGMIALRSALLPSTADFRVLFDALRRYVRR
ncbi:oligosaccharide flippase family protein [Aurantiacibacter sp. MUD61]|uniref:oligosaccharide flippase family protein n=1 Tax=Aurantiacibacter sp. MUD61 TaxID=3009083 RepID=UPI0022F035C5|nr:oligosaccharide flippase family protein [Aurantiacibacter sp. MUD61]